MRGVWKVLAGIIGGYAVTSQADLAAGVWLANDGFGGIVWIVIWVGAFALAIKSESTGKAWANVLLIAGVLTFAAIGAAIVYDRAMQSEFWAFSIGFGLACLVLATIANGTAARVYRRMMDDLKQVKGE